LQSLESSSPTIQFHSAAGLSPVLAVLCLRDYTYTVVVAGVDDNLTMQETKRSGDRSDGTNVVLSPSSTCLPACLLAFVLVARARCSVAGWLAGLEKARR
jgi:hypothetical protein